MWAAMGAPVALSQQIEKASIDVYPENHLPLQIFSVLFTQWHTGMGGREGLMYSAVYQEMDERGIRKAKQRQDLMSAVRVREREALNVWGEKRKN